MSHLFLSRNSGWNRLGRRRAASRARCEALAAAATRECAELEQRRAEVEKGRRSATEAFEAEEARLQGEATPLQAQVRRAQRALRLFLPPSATATLERGVGDDVCMGRWRRCVHGAPDLIDL
eukprot:COSAG01_NODE_2380_length_7793_cov_118.038602_5_plen_122_part_00